MSRRVVILCRELGEARERPRLAAALERLEALATLVEVPVLRFAPVSGEDAAALEDAARRVAAGGFDAIVFTSARGVEHWPRPAPAADGGAVVWSVGGRTEAAARARFPAARHRTPGEESTGRALASAMTLADMAGQRVLIVRVDIAGFELSRSLAAAGADVEEVIAYRSLPPGDEVLRALGDAITRDPAAIALTSPSAARSLAAVLASGRTLPRACAVAAIGPTTASELERLGIVVDLVSGEQDLADLCERISGRLEAE